MPPARHLLSDPATGPLPSLLLCPTAVSGLVHAVSVLRLGRVFVANMTGTWYSPASRSSARRATHSAPRYSGSADSPVGQLRPGRTGRWPPRSSIARR
jgi:hypothetical protein